MSDSEDKGLEGFQVMGDGSERMAVILLFLKKIPEASLYSRISVVGR